MKKLKKIKFILIAAGILISAAFYVFSGEHSAALGNGGDSLVIGGDAEGTAVSGAGDLSLSSDSEKKGGLLELIGGSEAKESGDESELQAEAVSVGEQDGSEYGEELSKLLTEAYAGRMENELYVGIDGKGYLSDALKEELQAYIREAVREELTALCEEGYLEQAVNEAADYAAAEAERKAGLVNINTADAAELMTLPGVGEKRASDIIAYRDAHGAFTSPEDIMQVSGIKQSAYDKIKDKIYTE